MIDCVRRETCRLCGSRALAEALALEPTPIGDAYVPESRASEPQPRFPLTLMLCGECAHVQLSHVVDPNVLFSDYTFVTASSPGLVRHLEQYASDTIKEIDLKAGSLVVELGSNDGTLLRFFKEAGMSVLGVDPARGIAAAATAAGIETRGEFFGIDAAKRILAERGKAALVTAHNVFAHIDDLSAVTHGIKEMLAPDGAFVFEVSYLLDTLEKTLFDTIYHEHLCYHSVKPLVGFFDRHGLELYGVERVAAKGGSIRCFVQQKGGTRPVSPDIEKLCALEDAAGLDKVGTYKAYESDLCRIRSHLHEFLGEVRSGGREIAGFGASVTVTTLLYHMRLQNFISFLLDDNPEKAGLLSPGAHIPVVGSSALYERNPSAVVILAWQYAEPIMSKHRAFIEGGGRFIVPLPQLAVFAV